MFPSVYRAVRAIQREFPFDLIDAHWVNPNGVLACKLGQAFGKPVVVTARGADMREQATQLFVSRQIGQALRRAAFCIGVSTELADAMIAHGASRDRVGVIPNGVDTERFQPVSMVEARRELGMPLNVPVILSVGHLSPIKGFDLLVEAFSNIRLHEPQSRLYIVGGEPTTGPSAAESIRSKILHHRLEHSVTLVGPVSHDRLRAWYSAADVFVLLSRQEGWPNVVMESLACGTPVVATAVGGTSEILADTKLGMLVPRRTADDAARTIRRALHADWDRSYIRAAMESRSWDATASLVKTVYDDILSGSRDVHTRDVDSSGTSSIPCSGGVTLPYPIRW